MRTLRGVHGRHDLVAGAMAGTFKARAFLRGAPQGTGPVAEAEGASAEAALEAIRGVLDARDRERAARRRALPGADGVLVPRPDEFREALLRVRPHEGQWAMLRAHARAGSVGLTAGELVEAAGYGDYGSANLQYGLLGQAVADALGIKAPASRTRPREGVPTVLLASAGAARSESGQFVWIMHPELIEALGDL